MAQPQGTDGKAHTWDVSSEISEVGSMDEQLLRTKSSSEQLAFMVDHGKAHTIEEEHEHRSTFILTSKGTDLLSDVFIPNVDSEGDTPMINHPTSAAKLWPWAEELSVSRSEVPCAPSHDSVREYRGPGTSGTADGAGHSLLLANESSAQKLGTRATTTTAARLLPSASSKHEHRLARHSTDRSGNADADARLEGSP